MDDANSKRMMKVKIISGDKNKPAIVELLYPSMYKFSCMLNLRFFPYDIQVSFSPIPQGFPNFSKF